MVCHDGRRGRGGRGGRTDRARGWGQGGEMGQGRIHVDPLQNLHQNPAMSARLFMALLPEVALLLVSPQLAAQKKSYAVLAGVDSVDATVSLTWDKRIPNLDENTVRSRLQTVFELELRQDRK